MGIIKHQIYDGDYISGEREGNVMGEGAEWASNVFRTFHFSS